MVERAKIVPDAARAARTREVILWCVEAYFGQHGSAPVARDLRSSADLPVQDTLGDGYVKALRTASAPRLSRFIRDNAEPILAEWETFARSLPGGGAMNVAALRDHAKEMLLAIAADLERPQSDRAQDEKARGGSDAGAARDTTAAQEHGTGRAGSGFTVGEMVAEFRALRASVTRLWLAEEAEWAHTDLTDLIRFNEAIDQAIAESVSRFSQAVAQTQERFLAILSHDLRTPLGAIITSTRFMLDAGELEEPNRTLVARASSSARRMNQMVLDLVEFTRTRLDDAIPVVRAEVDARRLVHDVVLEIAASYPDSIVQVETGGDLSGAWDADRLTQALTNLVGERSAARRTREAHPGVRARAGRRGDALGAQRGATHPRRAAGGDLPGRTTRRRASRRGRSATPGAGALHRRAHRRGARRRRVPALDVGGRDHLHHPPPAKAVRVVRPFGHLVSSRAHPSPSAVAGARSPVRSAAVRPERRVHARARARRRRDEPRLSRRETALGRRSS